jgi:hypothetical protein
LGGLCKLSSRRDIMRIELAHPVRVLGVVLAACLMLPAAVRASSFSISDLTESTPAISDTDSSGRLTFSPTSCGSRESIQPFGRHRMCSGAFRLDPIISPMDSINQMIGLVGSFTQGTFSEARPCSADCTTSIGWRRWLRETRIEFLRTSVVQRRLACSVGDISPTGVRVRSPVA